MEGKKYEDAGCPKLLFLQNNVFMQTICDVDS